MKGEPHSMARGIAAALAAALMLGDAAAATRNLFENEQPRARSGLPGLNALKEEGKKLAKEVVAKVNESYYTLAKHTPGFEAVYTVEENGVAAGKITISADFAKEDPLLAKFEGELTDKEMSDSIEIVVRMAWGPLVEPLHPANPTATRSGEGFLVSDQSPPTKFSATHMTVSKDYRLMKKDMLHENGAITDYVYGVQTVDGKHFVGSMESRTVVESVTLTRSLVYTYARREGVALIKRLEITNAKVNADTGEETNQAKCTVNLEKVTFKKTAAPVEVVEEEGTIGAEADWDEVSRQVISGIVENTLDFTTPLLYFDSSSCTIDISYTMQGMPASTATLSYSWEDVEGDGAISDVEVSTQIESVSDWVMKEHIKGVDKVLRGLATGCGLSLFLQRSVTAERTAQGYQLTLKTTTGDPPIQIIVTDDFRMIRGWAKQLDRSQVVSTYRYVAADDKKLLREMTLTTAPETGAFTSTDRWALDYTWVDGVPLLSEANILSSVSSMGGAFQSRQKFTMRDWKVTKRERPLRMR
jgi:hypothetical protein